MRWPNEWPGVRYLHTGRLYELVGATQEDYRVWWPIMAFDAELAVRAPFAVRELEPLTPFAAELIAALEGE